MRIADVRTHVLEAKLSEPFAWSFNSTAVRTRLPGRDRLRGRHRRLGRVLRAGRAQRGHRRGLPPAPHRRRPARRRSHLAAPLQSLPRPGPAGAHHHGAVGRRRGAVGHPRQALRRADPCADGRPGAAARLRPTPPAPTGAADADPLGYIVEEVKGYAREGFPAVKLKIGFGVAAGCGADPRRAARPIGPKVGLMLDANHGYDVAEAIELGRRVADCDIGWFEEPVVPEDLAGYAEVRRGQPIPVAGGETWFTRWNFRDVLARPRRRHHPARHLRRRRAHRSPRRSPTWATAFGVRCVPHVWGTGVGLATALQLLAVLPQQSRRATRPSSRSSSSTARSIPSARPC